MGRDLRFIGPGRSSCPILISHMPESKGLQRNENLDHLKTTAMQFPLLSLAGV